MKLSKKIGVTVVALAAAGSIPVIPSDTEWLRSYETVEFETRDGDLGMDQYSIMDGVYFIRTQSKSQAHFVATSSEDAIANKKYVEIRCEKCAYYSEFVKRNGEIVRLRYESAAYDALLHTRNAPQPAHAELLSAANLIATPPKAAAAIAFDTANSTTASGVSSVSFAITVAANGNMGLFVEAAARTSNCTQRAVSSITFDGVGLTPGVANACPLPSTGFASGGTDIWYMVNPPTGSPLTVGVSWGATTVTSFAGAISLSGVDQSTPIGDTGTADGQTTSGITVTVDTLYTDSWLVSSEYSNENVLMNPTQTRRWFTDGGAEIAEGSTATTGAPGAYTIGFTTDGGSELAIASALEVKEYVAPPAVLDQPDFILFK